MQTDDVGQLVYRATDHLPVGSSPCMFPTYLNLGFASSLPGFRAISNAHKSTPLALLPMLNILLISPHLDGDEKSRKCFSCSHKADQQLRIHEYLKQ